MENSGTQLQILMREYNALRQELDYWRQRDNHILFTLNNPPEMDSQRGYILENMRRCLGGMQRLEPLILGLENGG